MGIKIFSALVLLFLPFFLDAQNAEDIVFYKPGYSIEKILETNKVWYPGMGGLCFEDNGNLLVASTMSWVYQVEPDGSVSKLKYPCGGGLWDVQINPLNNDIIVGGGSGIYKYDKEAGNHVQISYDKSYYMAIDKYGNIFSSYSGGMAPQIQKYEYDKDHNTYMHKWTKTYPGYSDLMGIVLDSDDNLYICMTFPSEIIRLSPPNYDLPYEIFVETPEAPPGDIDRDEAGNFYILASDPLNPPDNYWLRKNMVMKIPAGSKEPTIIKDNLPNCDNLTINNDEIFLNSAYHVVKKIDINGNLTDYSISYEVGNLDTISSDLEGNPIVSTGTLGKIFRIMPQSQPQILATNLGYISGLETNNLGELFSYSRLYKIWGQQKGYLYKIPFDGSLPQFIDNPGPFNATIKFLHLDNGHLALYDRGSQKKILLLNHLSKDITELANNITGGVGFDLDDENSLYLAKATGQAIKRAPYPVFPPLDWSDVPDYITMKAEDIGRIGYFEVAPNNDVYIPVSQGLEGRIYIGPSGGGYAELLASGFNYPNATHFDRYGQLWVIDCGNGLFKITHQESVLARNIANCDDLIEEVEALGIGGFAVTSTTASLSRIRDSLIAKLRNAKDSLGRGNATAAIGQLLAFKNEVEAQAGKAVPVDTAFRWTAIASGMIKALQGV